jgi:hypothetical protein
VKIIKTSHPQKGREVLLAVPPSLKSEFSNICRYTDRP